jgi:uncharacterized membrane protein
MLGVDAGVDLDSSRASVKKPEKRGPSVKKRNDHTLRTLLFAGIILAMIFVFPGFTGCGSGDLPLDQVDPNAVPADPSFEHVFSIVQRECTPCHNDGGEDGDEKDEDGDKRTIAASDDDPDYGTCEGLIEELDDFYEEIFEKNSMPPGAWPRLTSEEKLVIQRWLDNGAEAPCKTN